MWVFNVVLDFYSFLVCLILFLSLCFGEGRKKKLNRQFVWMCACNIGVLTGDAFTRICEGFGHSWYPAALWWSCLFLYVCCILLVLAYTKYVLVYLSANVHPKRGFAAAAGILSGIYLFCLILSQFNGMFYWIDEDNVYHRGGWYWLSQAVAVAILLIDTAMVFIYRRYIRRKDVYSFSGYIIIPILTVVVQYFFYGPSLTYTGSTLALLIIFINIQAEQELVLKRKEKELAESRVSLMLSQIQPHFLYNSLTAIRHLCTSNPKEAEEAVLEFSDFLRSNMASLSYKSLIPFLQECRHVHNYLVLEQRRFGERLNVVYDLKVRDFKIPPLTLQPIVENAVRHGVTKRELGGTVIIRTEETAQTYLVIVIDDGAGFDPSAPYSEGRQHIGIENVQSRMASMCGGSLEVRSSPGKGTTAVLTIPKK